MKQTRVGNDVSSSGTVSPAVRKRIGAWRGLGACRGAALCGASLSARTLAQAEARQWLAGQRHKAPEFIDILCSNSELSINFVRDAETTVQRTWRQ